jgi:RimJ/RimL family protein N-acetyltransferase
MVVDIRLWSEDDFPLLERLMGDAAMTAHLGGPETQQQLRERHQRYCQISDSGQGFMYVIVAGVARLPAGSVGYWEKAWRNDTVWETGWSVLPEFQGQGIATQATALLLERAREKHKHQYIHAFPSVDNGASNAVCRKLGFTLLEAMEFEYPPGNLMRCNDWRLDLFATPPAVAPDS